MARNIEIKARVENPATLRDRVEAIADSGPITIQQEDVFFECSSGRLKLRKFPDGSAELIQYHRPDSVAPSSSDYIKVEVSDAIAMEEALSRAFGVRGVVRKERKLYMVDRTRIHLDRVAGLGNFVELEVVLAEGESDEEATAEADRLVDSLGITTTDLVQQAYIDLLEQTAMA